MAWNPACGNSWTCSLNIVHFGVIEIRSVHTVSKRVGCESCFQCKYVYFGCTSQNHFGKMCVYVCVCVVDFGKCLHILNDASHTQTEATSRFSKIQSNRQRFHNVHNHQLNQLSYRLKSSFDLFKVHTEGDRERERGREKIASIWRAFQKLIRIHFIYIYKYMHASMYVRSCYFL